MDVVSKSTGDSYAAAELNQSTNELENALSSTGQTPAAGDLFQVGKAMADYAAHGDFYTDSGAASVYVLTAISPKQSITAYSNGTRLRFVAGNTNTGSSTVNAATLGVIDILNSSGNPLTGGEIVVGKEINLRYNSSLGDFILTNANNSGSTIQQVNVQTGAVATGTTVMIADDTIPQNTEGDEYMTLAITPTDATSKLKIEIEWFGSHSSTDAAIYGALFQDATADALAAGWGTKNSIITGGAVILFTHYMPAGTISATTFKFRAGTASVGTTTFNGAGGARQFGGVIPSSITITELKA